MDDLILDRDTSLLAIPSEERRRVKSVTLFAAQLDFHDMTNLRHLCISVNVVSSLLFLAECRHLEYLDCSLNGLTSLDGINAPHLHILDCSDNKITSLQPLSSCCALTSLSFTCNNISTLEPIQQCLMLRYLDCSENNITSLTPIKGCSRLQHLDCSDNKITTLGAFSQWKELTNLCCIGNLVSPDERAIICHRVNGLNYELGFANPKLRGIDKIPHLYLAYQEDEVIARWYSALSRVRALILPIMVTKIQRLWRYYWEEELVETEEGIKVNRLCLYSYTSM